MEKSWVVSLTTVASIVTILSLLFAFYVYYDSNSSISKINTKLEKAENKSNELLYENKVIKVELDEYKKLAKSHKVDISKMGDSINTTVKFSNQQNADKINELNNTINKNKSTINELKSQNNDLIAEIINLKNQLQNESLKREEVARKLRTDNERLAQELELISDKNSIHLKISEEALQELTESRQSEDSFRVKNIAIMKELDEKQTQLIELLQLSKDKDEAYNEVFEKIRNNNDDFFFSAILTRLNTIISSVNAIVNEETNIPAPTGFQLVQ